MLFRSSHELALPLTLVIDGRGLCRLLWVGPLEQSGRLLEKLPGSERRLGSQWRLVTCLNRAKQLDPNEQEGVVGLDLAPQLWLRFGNQPQAGGQWPALIATPGGAEGEPWPALLRGDLAELASADPAAWAIPTPPAAAAEGPRQGDSGQERVLLLALTPGDQIGRAHV